MRASICEQEVKWLLAAKNPTDSAILREAELQEQFLKIYQLQTAKIEQDQAKAYSRSHYELIEQAGAHIRSRAKPTEEEK